MDFAKNLANSLSNQNNNNGQAQGAGNNGMPQGQQQSNEGGIGGFLSGLGNKMNAAAGGGPESEKNEDYLDKGTVSLPMAPRVK